MNEVILYSILFLSVLLKNKSEKNQKELKKNNALEEAQKRKHLKDYSIYLKLEHKGRGGGTPFYCWDKSDIFSLNE